MIGSDVQIFSMPTGERREGEYQIAAHHGEFDNVRNNGKKVIFDTGHLTEHKTDRRQFELEKNLTGPQTGYRQRVQFSNRKPTRKQTTEIRSSTSR